MNLSAGIALRPEFIVPQDGHDKQDCETAAGKRWLDKHAAKYLAVLDNNVTYLGDDLYSRQPFCRRVLQQRSHFIFTCKPDSHPHLSGWLALLDKGGGLRTIGMKMKNAKGHLEEHTYRFANDVPLVEGEGALKVNWREVTITGKHRKTPYHSTWVTDWRIDDENISGIVATARCRWKIENEYCALKASSSISLRGRPPEPLKTDPRRTATATTTDHEIQSVTKTGWNGAAKWIESRSHRLP